MKKIGTSLLTAFTLLTLATGLSAKADTTLIPGQYGVDISEHNNNLDFKSLQNSGISFTIIRLGFAQENYGTNTSRGIVNDDTYKDIDLEANVAAARQSGMNILGYYLYSYAVTKSDALAEAEHAIKLLNRISADKNSYVIFDLEEHEQSEATDSLTDISITFLERVRQAGYKPMLYTGYSYYYRNLDESKLSSYDKWIAHYGARVGRETINSEQTLIERDASLDDKIMAIPNIKIWQFSSTAVIAGSGGFIDLNVVTGTNVEEVKTDGSKIAMYRVYNSYSREHLYTPDYNEANTLVRKGWQDEKIAWYSPTTGSPVYRAYNPKSGEHLYTTDSNEKTVLVSKGWKDEGISWYSGGSVPIYRLYNPVSGAHHYTRDANERTVLISRYGWKAEGTAWTAVE